jgi:hypothetical protein
MPVGLPTSTSNGGVRLILHGTTMLKLKHMPLGFYVTAQEKNDEQ